MMKAQKWSIPVIMTVLIIVTLVYLNPGREGHDQWCARCGERRHITTYNLGSYERLMTQGIEETVLSRYHTKLFGPCSDHEWRNYHGWISRLRSRLSYSGHRPMELVGFEHDMEFLYLNDPALLREMLQFIIELSGQKGSREKDKFREELLGDLSFETDITQWQTRWSEFKNQNNI